MASCSAVLPFSYVSHNSVAVAEEKNMAETDLQSQQSVIHNSYCERGLL